MKNSIKMLLERIAGQEGDFRYDDVSLATELERHDQATSNIVIKILSAIGGLLSTLAFLGLLLLTGLYESHTGMLIAGILLVIAATGLSRIDILFFLETVGITFYISGFSLIGFGLGELHVGFPATLIVFLLIALLSLFTARGFMMILLSVCMICVCLVLYFPSAHVYGVLQQIPMIVIAAAFFVVTGNEAGMLSGSRFLNRLYKPLQAGLFLSLLAGLVFLRHADGGYGYFYTGSRILSAGISLLLCLLLYRVLQVLEIKKMLHKVCVYALALAICGPTIDCPGIAGSLFLLLMSFRYGYKAQAALSTLAFAWFVSVYYYDMGLSLLYKSALLFFPGILLMAAWYYFNRQTDKDEPL